MKNIWKWIFMILVAFLVSGCDTGDTGDNVLTGDEPVLCTGEKSDDLNCVPDESADADTYVEDDIWESPDSEIHEDDVAPIEECIIPIPDGAEVDCADDSYKNYILEWDMENCTATLWRLNGEPPPLYSNIPPDLLIGGDEYMNLYCVQVTE